MMTGRGPVETWTDVVRLNQLPLFSHYRVADRQQTIDRNSSKCIFQKQRAPAYIRCGRSGPRHAHTIFVICCIMLCNYYANADSQTAQDPEYTKTKQIQAICIYTRILEAKLIFQDSPAHSHKVQGSLKYRWVGIPIYWWARDCSSTSKPNMLNMFWHHETKYAGTQETSYTSSGQYTWNQKNERPSMWKMLSGTEALNPNVNQPNTQFISYTFISYDAALQHMFYMTLHALE